jgi:hypothetical protein
MKCNLQFTRKDWSTLSTLAGKFKFSTCAKECKLEWVDSVDGHENTSAWLWYMINNPDLSFGRFLGILGNFKRELETFIGSSQHLDFVKSERIKRLEYDRQELIEREIIKRGGEGTRTFIETKVCHTRTYCTSSH